VLLHPKKKNNDNAKVFNAGRSEVQKTMAGYLNELNQVKYDMAQDRAVINSNKIKGDQNLTAVTPYACEWNQGNGAPKAVG
jgi:hypothetical protein